MIICGSSVGVETFVEQLAVASPPLPVTHERKVPVPSRPVMSQIDLCKRNKKEKGKQARLQRQHGEIRAIRINRGSLVEEILSDIHRIYHYHRLSK
jgi:hypothetical protein